MRTIMDDNKLQLLNSTGSPNGDIFEITKFLPGINPLEINWHLKEENLWSLLSIFLKFINEYVEPTIISDFPK
jgi:hypothetical protein